MPEVAKCPLCGKEPEVWCRDEEWRVRITCCKHVVYSTASWNRYAAAMELARAVLRLHKDDSKTAHQWEFFVEEAEKRVLEVFK